MPGEVVRGLVSLWLIIHFLGIILAVATQNELARPASEGELSQSQLLNRLKQVPPLDQYIYALWLDVPYSYNQANNSPLDGDFSLRFDLVDAEGKKLDPIIWPSDDVDFGERRERLARLAYWTANYADRGDSFMVASIGKAVLTQTGAKDLELSIWRRQPLSLEDARSSDATLSDPKDARTLVRVYVAKVRLNLSGEAEVSVPQEARDVAAPNTGASSSTTPPATENTTDTKSPDTKTNDDKKSGNARTNSRRQQADALPQPERSQTGPKIPSSLFRPSEPLIDPNAPPR